MLECYRVLDLTDEKGLLCGKILADLGADVIKVEKPGGDPARNMGPFYHDMPDSEKSLYWFAYNSNKRSLTLDIETRDGQALFKKLVGNADFVLESFSPGYLDSLGLGYSALSQLNPRVIVVSISPFGQSGPYKDYKGTDIVIMALSGYLYLTGEPGATPVRISFPQSYLHAGAEAAVGAMTALSYRHSTGQGQHVDVSSQQCMVWCLRETHQFWELLRIMQKRAGVFSIRPVTGAHQRMIWPCKDGYVAFAFLGGPLAPYSKRMVEWLESEGAADEFIRSIDWDKTNLTMATPEFEDNIVANGLIPRFSNKGINNLR